MKVTFWGTRGSIATPGPQTLGYGGDTACVTIGGDDPGHLLILDAGSGIRQLGNELPASVTAIDLLLSHLHLDHIIGLGFFLPLFRADLRVTIWAPPSVVSLLERLSRYLSPPLFPVRLRDLGCELELRDATEDPVVRGEFSIAAASIIHPDTAVGYRVSAPAGVVAYLPDHEPALSPAFPGSFRWTSGAAIAKGADLLIHDAQYDPTEYLEHVGWGHSSMIDAVAFADLVGAGTLALFHHDPAHDDGVIDQMTQAASAARRGDGVVAARQGSSIDLGLTSRF